MKSKVRGTIRNPWGSIEAQAAEIRDRAEPVDYSRIFADSQVLILGEVHSSSAARRHIAANAENLKNLGVTHYGIEAPKNSAIDRFNRDLLESLDGVQLGPHPYYQRDLSYEQAVRAMATSGIKIVAADIRQTPFTSIRKREKHLTKSVQEIVQKNLGAKALVLIGALHAYKNEEKSMAGMLARRDVRVAVAQFHEGREYMFFSRAAADASLGMDEFMLDLRPYRDNDEVMFGPGNADFVIHLPEEDGANLEHTSWSSIHDRFNLFDPTFAC